MVQDTVVLWASGILIFLNLEHYFYKDQLFHHVEIWHFNVKNFLKGLPKKFLKMIFVYKKLQNNLDVYLRHVFSHIKILVIVIKYVFVQLNFFCQKYFWKKLFGWTFYFFIHYFSRHHRGAKICMYNHESLGYKTI